MKSNCSVSVKCDRCLGNHLTAMHIDRNDSADTNPNSTKSSMCTRTCNDPSSLKDCSKIVIVDLSLKSSDKAPLRAYAILDEQSNSSFVDPKVAEYFEISGPVTDYTLRTLHGSSSNVQSVTIKDLFAKGVKEKTKFALPTLYTNPYIPNCKSEIASRDTVQRLPNIKHFAKYFCDIDDDADAMLLLGRDSKGCLFSKCMNRSVPFVHRTALGWALVGSCRISHSGGQPSICSLRTNVEHFSASPCFETELKWELPPGNPFKELPDDESSGLSKDDQAFLQKLSSEIRVSESGHKEVPLPFRHNDPVMPNNKLETFHRSNSTLSRLKRDEPKLRSCLDVMQKYIDADHVEEVPPEEFTPLRPNHAWWIPVFSVTHPKKKKVRIVFDSAARYHGTSLNDQLLPGPDVINRLKYVLLGFRCGYVAFSADIECMFHNFRLRQQDKDYLRFLWYQCNDPSREITQFRAKVHIFGNSSSPAVAVLGLRYAVNLHPASNDVKQYIEDQFYVDDGLSSADTIEQATSVLKETVETLNRCNIRLHKFMSSSQEVVMAFPESERAVKSTHDFENNAAQSALGLIWDTSSDVLVLRTEIPKRPFTRRGILAIAHSVFDPLGICSPIILKGKHLQRKIMLDSDPNEDFWDADLPIKFKDEWDEWKSSLSALSGMSISRCYRPEDFGLNYSFELHCFCDASLDGTGYVIYMRSLNNRDDVCISFVCANSRITPKSSPTIPRLELCAALELSEQASEISDKLKIPIRKNSPLREYQRCNRESFSTNKTKENWRVIK